VTVRNIAGRRAGKRPLAARPVSKLGIQLGCKTSGAAARANGPIVEKRFACNGFCTAALAFPAGIAENESSNYARNGTKPAQTKQQQVFAWLPPTSLRPAI
jgi:hypothetical protein